MKFLPILYPARFCLTVVLACGASAEIPARTPLQATITIHAAGTGTPVNRLVFGHGNIEAGDTSGIHGVRTNIDFLRTGAGVWDSAAMRPSETFLHHARETGMSLLRYPGGCIAHNFDWRKAVGPRESRGDWLFGLDEFLATCRVLGAEPLITVSDYVLPADEMPRHAAELVEYLNAPATPEYPQALKRAANGHPEPYAVRYFELGNESDHGNHAVKPRRQYTPVQYARYAIETAAAMRAVDPSVKLGIATVPGTGETPRSEWNLQVLRLAGHVADFVAVHYYTPRLTASTLIQPSDDLLMRACMAAGDQIGHRIRQYNSMIREVCGRGLPLAVTEFNVAFIQPMGAPKPWRLSYGAALQSADLLRVFLQPENNVLLSSYWQFINGYWGAMSTRTLEDGSTEVDPRPAYSLFRLWGKHFGDHLLQTRVDAPRSDFEGYPGVAPARGDHYRPRTALHEIPLPKLQSSSGTEFTTTMDRDGIITLHMDELTGEAHPTLFSISRDNLDPMDGDIGYRLSFEGQFRPSPGSAYGRQGLTIADSRGWAETRSATPISGVQNLGAWSPVYGEFIPRDDCPGITILGRLEADSQKISGRLQIRNLRLEAFRPEIAPATALLTAAASRSVDGKKLFLIVFNKSPEDAITTSIRIEHFHPAPTIQGHEVNAPGLAAFDGIKETMFEVRPETRISGESSTFQYTFPAHSMTALELNAWPKP